MIERQPTEPFTSSGLSKVKSDISISAITAGFIATLVSFAGPILIIFQAAKVANLTDAQLSSWIWAISVGSGFTCILLRPTLLFFFSLRANRI